MNAKVMAVAALSAFLAASGSYAGGGGGQTIAEVVSGDPNFSTLLTAVQAAGLVDTLNSAGPFTVFAPTNAAFAKVPSDQLQSLLNDPAALKNVLLYHVVLGRVTSAQVVRLSTAKTVQGANLNISAEDGTVKVNDATVTDTDIPAVNGVIHVIDTVLLPPS